jgi:hypothetical protein
VLTEQIAGMVLLTILKPCIYAPLTHFLLVTTISYNHQLYRKNLQAPLSLDSEHPNSYQKKHIHVDSTG